MDDKVETWKAACGDGGGAADSQESLASQESLESDEAEEANMKKTTKMQSKKMKHIIGQDMVKQHEQLVQAWLQDYDKEKDAQEAKFKAMDA